MKQTINLEEQNLPEFISEYIRIWKEKKGYEQNTSLSLGQCIELLVATTYNLHNDYSDGRFFNKILINDESAISWDGNELIDILFYEVIKNIQRRMANSRTFNEPQIDPE